MALLTAVVTALGVVAGLLAKRANSADTKADTSQQQTQALETQVRDLRSENHALREELAQLREERPTATSPSASPPVRATEEPSIYRQGPVTLIRGEEIDIDAPPNDLQWGMTRAGQGGFDLRFDGNYLISVDGQLVRTTATPTYETCTTIQGYDRTRISLSALQDTPTICVISGTGRQGVFAVKRVSAAKLEFQVTAFGN